MVIIAATSLTVAASPILCSAPLTCSHENWFNIKKFGNKIYYAQ